MLNRQFIQLPGLTISHIAIFVQHQNPSELVQRTRRVTYALTRHAKASGLDVNFAKGKTEALIRLQGRGSRQAHAELNQLGSATLEIGPDAAHLAIPVTSAYPFGSETQCLHVDDA